MDILAKNLLILASAGSGKTFQLGNRIIALVARGESPEKIVALTFTRKAAGEFADSVLTKLAHAASSAQEAARLKNDLGMPSADFHLALERIIRILPDFTLGTMDGFFARIVRSFQYELGLTGGRFELLEGPRAAAMADEILASVLGDGLPEEVREPFYHAFRRATIGRENHGILAALRDFTKRWHWRFREAGDLEWGPQWMTEITPEAWSGQKAALAAAAMRGLDDIQFTDARQRKALENAIIRLENHVIGGGSLGKETSGLLASILSAVAEGASPLAVKHYKDFTIGGTTCDALQRMVGLAARCELSSALHRTRAIKEVMRLFDHVCDTHFRKKGLLGFNDVKLLMGEWASAENARLRREAVDFRLGARYEHWLLDEFQDTSRADWNGLLPLIDEAATSDNGSVFIVGDKKQAIYGWRGGDVGLFDEITRRYSTGLEVRTMAESWRSCPEVLELVNRICGDKATMAELFGPASAEWEWEDHFSAEPLRTSEKRGQARVEVVGDRDERLNRMVEILHETGVGTRKITCGILLRSNTVVAQVADHLRSNGFDVIEEGRRKPAEDHPVGIAIHELLKWLADPADPCALEIIRMSPLADTLCTLHGTDWTDMWERISQTVSRKGFAAVVQQVIEGSWHSLSDFGRRRAGDLISSLSAIDTRGGCSASDAADWIGRLEVSQNPGVAAVQVMTIHKSKGLGFDIVILPEIPTDEVPQAQHFDVATGEGWLTDTPPKWARAVLSDLQMPTQRWEFSQRHEALCTLYVALTRAKRGLYVLLEPPSTNTFSDKPSLATWIGRSTAIGTETGTIYQTGCP